MYTAGAASACIIYTAARETGRLRFRLPLCKLLSQRRFERIQYHPVIAAGKRSRPGAHGAVHDNVDKYQSTDTHFTGLDLLVRREHSSPEVALLLTQTLHVAVAHPTQAAISTDVIVTCAHCLALDAVTYITIYPAFSLKITQPPAYPPHTCTDGEQPDPSAELICNATPYGGDRGILLPDLT